MEPKKDFLFLLLLSHVCIFVEYNRKKKKKKKKMKKSQTNRIKHVYMIDFKLISVSVLTSLFLVWTSGLVRLMSVIEDLKVLATGYCFISYFFWYCFFIVGWICWKKEGQNWCICLNMVSGNNNIFYFKMISLKNILRFFFYSFFKVC